MARASNIDANQPALVRALRSCGASVAVTSGVARASATLRGFPDLVVGCALPCPHCGGAVPSNAMLEIKNPAKPPSARALTADELAFHSRWRGPIVVVESMGEALAAAGIEAR